MISRLSIYMTLHLGNSSHYIGDSNNTFFIPVLCKFMDYIQLRKRHKKLFWWLHGLKMWSETEGVSETFAPSLNIFQVFELDFNKLVCIFGIFSRKNEVDLKTLLHQRSSSLCLCKRFKATGSATDTYKHNEIRVYTSLSYIVYNKTKYTKLNPNLQHPVPRNFQAYLGTFI